METFRAVIAHRSDPTLRDRLRELESNGRVVHLQIAAPELGRRRLRLRDEHGVEYGVALPRSDRLRDGAVLLLENDRAVVVAGDEEEVLEVRARDAEAALRLGWHAGHLHWRVRFPGGDRMVVVLDAPREQYVDRIRRWLDDGSMEVVDER